MRQNAPAEAKIDIGYDYEMGLVVYDKEMYLRIKHSDEYMDIPVDVAKDILGKLNNLLPYTHRQLVWTLPIKGNLNIGHGSRGFTSLNRKS